MLNTFLTGGTLIKIAGPVVPKISGAAGRAAQATTNSLSKNKIKAFKAYNSVGNKGSLSATQNRRIASTYDMIRQNPDMFYGLPLEQRKLIMASVGKEGKQAMDFLNLRNSNYYKNPTNAGATPQSAQSAANAANTSGAAATVKAESNLANAAGNTYRSPEELNRLIRNSALMAGGAGMVGGAGLSYLGHSMFSSDPKVQYIQQMPMYYRQPDLIGY